MTDAHAPLDARALDRLKWRCRRGMLENDLFLERFFARHGASLSERQAQALLQLMDLSDNELLDLLLARQTPSGDLATPDVLQILQQLRQSAADKA